MGLIKALPANNGDLLSCLSLHRVLLHMEDNDDSVVEILQTSLTG